MDEFSKLKTPEELLEYMKKNIHYGFVGYNGKKYYDMFSEEWNDWYTECYVQNGEEVIDSKIGTCWDQVELERVWFEKNHYHYHTFFIQFEVNKENNYPTHTFLIYEDGNFFYWFEHAFEAERGIHKFHSLDEAIEYVKAKQIEYTKLNNIEASDEDMDCLVVYEYTKPKDHLGVDDYLDFVTTHKYQELKKDLSK